MARPTPRAKEATRRRPLATRRTLGPDGAAPRLKRLPRRAAGTAAPIADGAQVVVPKRAAPGASPAQGTPAGPVHLNTATLEQLDALPGVGPTTTEERLPPTSLSESCSSLLEDLEGRGSKAAALPTLPLEERA